MGNPKKLPSTAWRRGQSGNPAGKPRGTRNHASLMIEAILESGACEVTKAVIEAAKAGDTAAARLVLERLLSPVRERPIRLDLPAIDSMVGVAEAQQVVLAAVAAGDLTPGEGDTVAGILDARRRAIETIVLEERIALLERSLKLTKGK